MDILLDALIDTLRLVPFLFLTYWAMEALEHAAGDRSAQAVERAGRAGPAIGALLGAFPQCGFSAAAATLYAGRVVTLGTLVAVFLATSDEMLPILIAEQADAMLIVKLLGIKVAIGMIMGFAVDAVVHVSRRLGTDQMRIHALCERDQCHCEDEEGSVLISALRHTLQVSLFIFLITLVLDGAIELLGEDVLAAFLSANPLLSIGASAVVGLIPNCAASVVVTELYLEGTLSLGAALAGLLVSAGIGLLVLLRTNRPVRENAGIVALLLAIGVLWGIIFEVAGFAL